MKQGDTYGRCLSALGNLDCDGDARHIATRMQTQMRIRLRVRVQTKDGIDGERKKGREALGDRKDRRDRD